MAEAMACGTPVIGFARGSVPEVIREGETGFVVQNVAEAVDAVLRIPSLSRAAARRDAEERFSSKAMLRGYLELYDAQLAIARGAQSATAVSTASISPAKNDRFQGSRRALWAREHALASFRWPPRCRMRRAPLG